MVNGNLPPLGYSDRQLARMNGRAEIGDHSLFYELGLSSYPPEFQNGRFVSPLLRTDSYFNYGRKNNIRKTGTSSRKTSKSGKRKYKTSVKDSKSGITKKMCVKFLESGKSINPLTGRTIKKNGPTYKAFMKKCEKYPDISGMKENKLTVSGSLKKIPKRTNYNDLKNSSIFRPTLPRKPNVLRY